MTRKKKNQREYSEVTVVYCFKSDRWYSPTPVLQFFRTYGLKRSRLNPTWHSISGGGFAPREATTLRITQVRDVFRKYKLDKVRVITNYVEAR